MLNTRLAAVFAAAAGAGAVYLGAHRLFNRVLIGMALDREEPALMKKALPLLSGGLSFGGDHVDKMKSKREEILAEAHEDVEIESFDGIRLVGHLYKRENAKRVLIAMHGWRSRWLYDFAAIWDFWRDEGCTVLCPEERAQGESGGDYMGFGLLERFDCLDWAKWVETNVAGGLPVYLTGDSMGAATILMTTGFADLPRCIHGVIADCGFTSPKAEFEHVVESNLHLPFVTHEKEADRMCKARIGMTSDAYSTLEAMKTNTRPILFIHGTDDHFVPARMSEENYAACKAPKELLLVEGADHAQSYIRDQERYEAAVREFFERYDYGKWTCENK